MNYKKRGVIFFLITLVIIDYIAMVDIFTSNYAMIEDTDISMLAYKLLGSNNMYELDFEKIFVFGLPYVIFGLVSAMIMYEYNCIDKINVVVRYKSRTNMMIRRLIMGAFFSVIFVIAHLGIVMMSITPNYMYFIVTNYTKEILTLIVRLIIYIYEITCIGGMLNIALGETITIVTGMVLYIFDAIYIFFYLGKENSISLMSENVNILTGVDCNYFILFLHMILALVLSILFVYFVRKRDLGIHGRSKK